MRLAVINNIPTPYIVAVFNALAERLGDCFDGVFLANGEANRRWTEVRAALRSRSTTLRSCGMFLKASDADLHLHWGLTRFLRDRRPDVVCICGYHYLASWELACLRRRGRIRTVLWSGSHSQSGALPSKAAGLYKRLIIPRFDAYVTYGTAARDMLVACGADPGRIVVGCNTVDVTAFAQMAKDCRGSHRQTRHERGEQVVLYVGDFLPRKNLAVLFRGFRLLRLRTPGARLRIVGTGSQTDAARELARELGVSDAEFVSFAERGDLVREYCEADVFVLPSAREVWGLVVNEAMACGVPTVVSNAAGCARDLVLPGVTGFTFDPKSPSELAQVLQDVLADPDQRREMGTEAMKRALLFTPEVYAERIVEAALVAMSSSGGSKKK